MALDDRDYYRDWMRKRLYGDDSPRKAPPDPDKVFPWWRWFYGALCFYGFVKLLKWLLGT